MKRLAMLAGGLVVGLLAGCGGSDLAHVLTEGDGRAVPRAAATTLGACALASPLRKLGPQPDAPGPDGQAPLLASPQGCRGAADRYRMGASVQDMTGPANDVISAGYEAPDHVLRGIHTRQFARAFALQSRCNGERVVMVVSETAFITQGTRQTVLDLIAADPELAPHYHGENVLLSATHTHSGPGGEAHHAAYNLFRLGYDELVHRIYTQAIHRAIRDAHAQLEQQPVDGRIRLSVGELLNASTNRSEPAYAANPPEERAQWRNVDGEEVRTNKRMVQLRLDRDDGTAVGLINWFGVHTTSVGTLHPLISSDNKGLAAFSFERLMAEAQPAALPFVAAFAQADEGDASPNLCFREFPFPDPRIGCGEDRLQGNASHGVRQLARAIELFDAGGEPLAGGIRSRLVNAPMDRIEVSDPVILERLRHPPELDTPSKRTCTAALGYSMAAGAEDQRGPSQEGISCRDVDRLAALQADIEVAMETLASNATGGGYPAVPASTFGTTLGCGLTEGLALLPPLPEVDYSCHAEKPILFPIGSTELVSNADLPLQIVTIGPFAVVALPWEVTTTAARRIRDTVVAELGAMGVSEIVVASLSNDFVQYLTTREEYATQEYEAASTQFGPWTLAAVQQELRKLAISLRDGTSFDGAVPAPRTQASLPPRLPYIAGDAEPDDGFGAPLVDAAEAYASGETVRVRFASAHPRNDTEARLNNSYAYAERELAPGQWLVTAMDRDPELILQWNAQPQSPIQGQALPFRQSALEVLWHLPRNLPAGRYRLRHQGTAVPVMPVPLVGQPTPFEGFSRAFEVGPPMDDCPGYPAIF